MNLEALRAELPVLRESAYLNTGTFGPLPRRAVEAFTAQARAELDRGRSGATYWERARALRTQARERLGAAIGAPPGTIALTRSTSDGCTIAVAGLRLGPDDEIVTTDCEHFGLLGALAASGARVRVARIRDLPATGALGAVEAEIGPRTRLVAISHVVWTNGHVMPVRELAGRDVPLLVDGAQGAGALPVDVGSLGCDFYTVSGQKWLLGPDGTGALYVAPERIEQQAIAFPSYFSQQRHEPGGSYEPAEGAARFDNGTVPVPALAGLLASLDFAEEAGEERFARARDLAARCRELLADRVEVVTEQGHSTLVTFRPPGEAAATVERLAGQGVVVREMPALGWVRASVGFWTSEEELERLAAGV